MKKKQLFLDSKNFNLFLERMDNKMTLSESTEKNLMVEGWIDDVIRFAKSASMNAANIVGKNLPMNVIDNLTKSFDNLIESAKFIDDAITKNLNDLRTIRNSIGIDAISQLKNNFNILLKNVVSSFGFDASLTKKLDDFVRGNVNDLDPDVLKVLDDSQIDIIVSLRNAHVGAMKELDDLDNLVKYVNIMGDNPSIVDLFNSMYVVGDVKTIDDFKLDWNRLDDIAKNDPESKVGQLWNSIKNNISGKPKNADDAATTLKNFIKNSDTYITANKSFRKKFIQYIGRKILGKVEDINITLNKKGIDWDNSLVYVGKDGNLNIVSARNKRELEVLKTYLENNGLVVREMDSNGVKIGDIGGGGGRSDSDIWAGRQNRKWKWTLIVLGVGTLAAGGYISYCASQQVIFTDEMLDNLKVSDPEGVKSGKYKNPGLWDRVLRCIIGGVMTTAEYTKKLAIDLFNANVRPYLVSIDGGILKYLNDQCGRESNEKNSDGSWKYPCTKCLDCDKDVDVNSIKINGKPIKDEYSQLIKNLDPRVLFPTDASGQEERLKQLMKEINSDAENGIVSKYISADGEAKTLEDMVKLVCVGHRLSCIEQQFYLTINECYQLEGLTCEEIDTHMTSKINVIQSYITDGVLNWGVTDGKVDVSSIKNKKGFEGATSVDDIIAILNIDKQNAINLCNNASLEVINGGNGDITIDLSTLMTDLWDSGEIKLDCAEYQYSLRSNKKYNMKLALTDVIEEIVSDPKLKSFIRGIDVFSQEWDSEFNMWWDKQRDLCNIKD
jgi:hypothetical protein